MEGTYLVTKGGLNCELLSLFILNQVMSYTAKGQCFIHYHRLTAMYNSFSENM